MSIAKDLHDYLELRLVSLLPTYKAVPFFYSQDENNRLLNKGYAIKLGSIQSTTGTNMSLTKDQDYQIELTQKWAPKKGQGDLDLREKIFNISGDIEKLSADLYRRTGSIDTASLLIISPLDVSEPDIDNDNNLVTLTLTLNVKYRVATL